MFRVIQHLLPRGAAWRTTVETTLRKYLEGLGAVGTDVREFIDLVYLDVLPGTTRELPAWEKQFALPKGGSEADRRLKLAAAWSMQGSQSPDFIQRTIHAAGFTTVFVHEWWEEGRPRITRNPHDYTTQPLTGLYQCEPEGFEWECWEDGPGLPLAPHCDDSLINDPGYIVNLDLTRRAPPPVPDDTSYWPFFLYFASATFPEPAPVPSHRVAELKEILLRICPAQQWLVLLLDPVDETEGFGSSSFGGAPFGS